MSSGTWQRTALGDICVTTSGGTPSRSRPEFFGGHIPWIKSGDLTDGAVESCSEYITQQGLSQSSAKLFNEGTILLAMYGATVGKLGILGMCAATNQAVCGITPPDALDRKFLFYFLLSQRPNLIGQSIGGAQPNISQTIIRELMLPIPPLPDQRRIVDLLTRAEGIVRLRREAADKAAELIPAIFIDMFGDPVRNPKAWPIVPLGSVATVQGGLQVTRARLSHPLERPYLRVANVYRDRLDLVEIKSIRLTEAELNRTRLQIGDLLFVEGHGNPQEVGRVAVWDGSIQDCTHQNHLIRARPNNDQLMPEFACVQLNTPAGRQSLLRAGKTTSGLSTISAQNVKDAEVMLPRMALQRDFVKLAEEAQSIATLQTEAQLKAQATFNALLAQAFAPHGSL
ncbi:MAG: restriction endonuclease subunit S [Rhodoferax sp.]|nr:restriction endonuclease subunit S [Rhodoferax sp.]